MNSQNQTGDSRRDQPPPDRLWLQWNSDAAPATLADKPVSGQDIEYVRAILSRAAVADLRQCISNVLDHDPLSEQGINDLAEALALLPEAD